MSEYSTGPNRFISPDVLWELMLLLYMGKKRIGAEQMYHIKVS